jgi:ATP-dependent DNA ligase
LKNRKTRRHQGNISKLARRIGFVLEVRFSEWIEGKRHQRALTFRDAEYPTDKDVRKAIALTVEAIALTVVQMSSATDRAKVEGLFGQLAQ